MSVILLVCYFLTEIRQIWGYVHFWMIYLSETFLRHSLDIGSPVFTLLGWAYILTFEFLCAGLNFETFDLVTFWFPGSALRPLVLLCMFYLLLFLNSMVNFEGLILLAVVCALGSSLSFSTSEAAVGPLYGVLNLFLELSSYLFKRLGRETVLKHCLSDDFPNVFNCPSS